MSTVRRCLAMRKFHRQQVSHPNKKLQYRFPPMTLRSSPMAFLLPRPFKMKFLLLPFLPLNFLFLRLSALPYSENSWRDSPQACYVTYGCTNTSQASPKELSLKRPPPKWALVKKTPLKRAPLKRAPLKKVAPKRAPTKKAPPQKKVTVKQALQKKNPI